METYQSSGGLKKIFISAMIAMALVNSVTLYFLFSEKKEKKEVIVQNTSLEQDYKNVTDTLTAREDEIDQLRGKNAGLDKLIADKEQTIEQEKKELAGMYAKNTLTVARLDKARKLIGTYEVTIAALQKQVEDFTAQTHQLTQEKEQLTTDLSCEQDANTQLSDQNEGLTKKVVAGSFLEIPKVNVEAVKRKHNGQEVDVDKVKATESLKISFETGANKVLDPGKLSLYVRIINPRGETIAVKEQGSGIIPETDTTKPIEYTRKTDIQWTQSNKKVVVYWNRYITDPGTYKVEVYQDGKVIGYGAVRLS